MNIKTFFTTLIHDTFSLLTLISFSDITETFRHSTVMIICDSQHRSPAVAVSKFGDRRRRREREEMMELLFSFPQLAPTDCQPPPGLESFYSLVGPGGGGWAGLGQERNTIIVLIDIKL